MNDARQQSEAPGAALPFKPLSWQASAAWIVVAAASLQLAYEVPLCAPLILFFYVGLYRLAHQTKAVFTLRAGWVLGLLVYGPQLAFFWRIFGVPALGLWLVLSCWLGLFLMLLRFVLLKAGSCSRGRRGLLAALPLLAAPVLWMGLEYTRSELNYLRFSWVNAGYALPGLGAWVGMYGVGFVVMFIGAWIAAAAGRGRSLLGAACAVIALALLAFTSELPSNPAPRSAQTLPIAGVQLEFPSIAIAKRALVSLHATHPDAKVLVLSEYTFDGNVPADIREWCARQQLYLIAGGKEYLNGGDQSFRNTVFVIGPDGAEILRQCKCVPIQFFKDGLPAAQQELWDSPWGKIGLCVCYDLSYTRITDELIRQGAQAIVIPTMDVRDWGERQHQLHARVAPARAAEYGVPIFRLCSSGISQVVERTGQVSATAAFDGEGDTIEARLQLGAPGRLPPDRYAAWPCVVATASVLAWCLWDGWRGGKKLAVQG